VVRNRQGTLGRLVVALFALSLVAAACGKSNKSSSGSTQANAAKGGTLVLAAEQEPDCTDWIGTCSGSSWGYWTMGTPTLPRAFDVKPDSTYTPGAVLSGEPKVDVGPPVKITYNINKDAVWSDGQPITSADFKYTWDQIAHGKDIYDKTGYEKITDVSTTDPKVAVATFSEPFAGYHDLFSAFYGILPSHILTGQDRDAALKDGYKWSGGPWMIDHWTKGQEIKLIPNPKWWGTKPNLDAVVFKIIADTAAEAAAYKTGQALGGYPQPQVDVATELKAAPDLTVQVNSGLSYEGLWFNVEKAPLTDKAVRQALGYAVDREAILNALIKTVKSDATVLNSFISANVKAFYNGAYSKYKLDLAKVTALMTGAGYKKGADGIWAKGAQKAALTISTTAGNKGREQVEVLLTEQLKAAGFDLKTDNAKAGDLFGTRLPKGQYTIGMYAQVPTPDPGQCNIWCAKNIPTAANSFSGQNWDRLKSTTLDSFWGPADKELDATKRADLVKKGQDTLADEVPALPLYQKLTLVVWNKARLHGPIGDNYVLGPFWNVDKWFCTNGKCS